MQNLSGKKVLCVGNATHVTDELSSLIALMNSTVNHGLVDDCNKDIVQKGIYLN